MIETKKYSCECQVNGDVWDLDRPFEADATVEFLKWDNPEAKRVYW